MTATLVTHPVGHDGAAEQGESLSSQADDHDTLRETRIRLVLLVASLVVTFGGGLLYYLVPPAGAGAVWDTTIVALLVLMLIGILRFHRQRPAAWGAIWLGLVVAFAGAFLGAHPDLAPFSVESPSIADLLKLLNYPLGAAGVLALTFRSSRRVGWRATLEALILIGAGATVIAILIMQPLVDSVDLTTLAGVVDIAYPLMDLLLLGVLVVALMHLDQHPGPLMLVVVALAGNFAADVAFGAQSLRGGFTAGTVVDLGWLICFAAFAIAPSWVIKERPVFVPDGGRISPLRLGLIMLGALAVPGISMITVLQGESPTRTVMVCGVALIALTLLRMLVFNRDLAAGRARADSLALELVENNSQLQAARLEQRQLLDQVQRVIEQERITIAAELHDRPLQNLVGVGYQLEYLALILRSGDTATAAELVDQASADLATQLGELRDLMTEIRPPVLDETGLLGAISDRARSIESGDPQLSVTVSGDCGRLPTEIETTLYRIALECLSNVVRHADASVAAVAIDADDETVSLICTDNGTGFDTSVIDTLVAQNHYGLIGMRERIELMGGTMAVNSDEHGTTLSFTAPTHTRPSPLSGVEVPR